MPRLKRIAAVLILVLASCFTLPGLAWAHGQTTAGDYELEIGFHNEPVYVGQPNGLDLFVTNTRTNEKVNGLEKTLKAEIIFGASRRTLAITPQDGVDGAYTAPIVPTAEGDYTWHIFGTIQNTPVDVSMTSSPTTFDSAESMTAQQFPSPQPSPAELQVQAAAASSTALVALIVGTIGALLGAAGLVVGLSSRRTTRRAPIRQ